MEENILNNIPLWLIYLLMAGLAYIIGSFPTGYLVVKKLTGQDIRQIGSGSTGATNVRRIAGKKAFYAVMLVDFLKGLFPVLLVRWFLPQVTFLHVLVAFVAVIGHSKSLFLGFTGGKSAATGLGTMFGLAPVVALCIGLVAVGVMKMMRIVSLGSLTAAVATPLLLVAFNEPFAYIGYGIVTAVYVIYLHRGNIQRLIQGTENKLE